MNSCFGINVFNDDEVFIEIDDVRVRRWISEIYTESTGINPLFWFCHTFSEDEDEAFTFLGPLSFTSRRHRRSRLKWNEFSSVSEDSWNRNIADTNRAI